MLRCAVLDDYQDVARRHADWSALAGEVEIEVFNDHLVDAAALAARLQDFDIVVAMRERTPFDRALIAHLPRLKLLVTTGMVNAAIDMEAASARGITVCGTESWVGTAAELTWALILAAARRIPEESANLRGGGPWQVTVGQDLRGRRLGVVGLGKLGSRVARVGRAFDMAVSGWSRSLTPEKAAALDIDHCAGLDELLASVDIVSLHLTLTPATRGLIDARRLGLMKPGALLVNTARGPLVDEAALIAALTAGRLAGAALDVFALEPLPADHPFRHLPNVLAVPHLGYVTERTYRAYYGGAVEDIAAWLAGDPVRVLAKPA